MSRIFADEKALIFIDYCHTTETANARIAEQIAAAVFLHIKERSFGLSSSRQVEPSRKKGPPGRQSSPVWSLVFGVANCRPVVQGIVAVMTCMAPSRAVRTVICKAPLDGTVGDDPGEVAVLLGAVTVGRVDHVTHLKSGLLCWRAGVNLEDLHAAAMPVGDRLLIDSEIPPLCRRGIYRRGRLLHVIL